jgi:hypothetical protein
VVVNGPSTVITFVAAGNIIGQYGAPGVVVTATVPLGTHFVAASEGGVLNGNVVVWDRGDARTKSAGGVWLQVSPDDILPNGSIVRSMATLADESGQWRQDLAQVVVLRTGPLPANAVVIPVMARNVP